MQSSAEKVVCGLLSDVSGVKDTDISVVWHILHQNITRDAVTGEVSFTISDSNGYSGVADVETEADIYAVDGAIVVECAAGRVSVSTLQGALVYDGIGGRIPVATGLYVVNVDGKAVKVAVR